MFATGGLPSYRTGYIYITRHLYVWFLMTTLSGGLVCFVTVGECMFMQSNVYLCV